MDKAQFLKRLPQGTVKPEPADKNYPLAPPTDLVACLSGRLSGNQVSVHQTDNAEQAIAKALELVAQAGIDRIGLAPLGEEMDQAAADQAEKLNLEFISIQDGDEDVIERCEPLEAGITRVDLAVAESGQILQLARPDGGRLMSLLPEWHIAILSKEDILPNLPALAERLTDAERFPEGPPAVASMISGPSKTGDIEGIIVYGAHGPRKLDVIMWG